MKRFDPFSVFSGVLIAHVCPCCGSQLIRKPVEFALGLPIVRCDCGYATVRRRHPTFVRWRSGCRAAKALFYLLVQAFLMALFTLASAGFIAVLHKELKDLGIGPWTLHKALSGDTPQGKALGIWLRDGAGIVLLILIPVFLVIVGGWLRCSMSRWPIPVVVWVAGVALALWHEWLLYPAKVALNAGSITRPASRDTAEQAVYFAAAVILVFCSAPIGRGLESLFRSSRRRRFIRQLRKRRAARKGQ